MRLKGAFLGVAAALLGVALAHDAWAGKGGGRSGGARSSVAVGARFAAPAARSNVAGRVVVVGSPQHRHFHSSFVAIGVGVPIYYPGAFYYPGYPGYYAPPPPGWYFCPAYNAYYPASVPCPADGPAQGYYENPQGPPGYYEAPPQMYGAPPPDSGVPPDYVPPPQ